MTWQLRLAGADDVAAIMSIETVAFGAGAWSENGMRTEVTNPQTYYLVAFRPESPDLVEGYAGLFAPHGAPEADVQTIAVAESARRTGLGRLLMTSLVNEARQRGALQVFLEVRADEPVPQRLYESLGFAKIAVRAGYYPPDGTDAIVMRLAVEPARTEWV